MLQLLLHYLINTLLLLLFLNAFQLSAQEDTIIDSEISFEESVSGKDFPSEIRKNLVLIEVYYYSFDKRHHKGQLLIHKSIEKDIKEIFEFIRNSKFPVNKVVPVSEYGWSDKSSVLDNNTSAFNYRNVMGTKKLSSHSTGKAIDINPLLNPHIKKGNASREYDPRKPGTLTRDSELVKIFIKKGWQWGGNWRSSKDYQHFEKK